MRLFHSLRVRLFLACALVAVVAVGTLSIFVTRVADHRFDEYEQTLERLQITRMAEWLVGLHEVSSSWEAVQPYVEEIQALSGTSVVLEDSSGHIVADSLYTVVVGLPPASWIEQPLVDARGKPVGTLYMSSARTI